MKKHQKRQVIVKTPRPKRPRTLRKKPQRWQRKDKQEWNGIEHGQMWRRHKDRYA